MIKGQLEGLKDGNTKLKFEVGSLTYDEVDKVSQNTINNSSNLIAKENLVLDSLTDINIQGSNLKADENLVLNSTVGDINILNTTDISNEDIKEKHAKAALNLTVQNEYVETAQAVKAAVESAEQLKHTKDDYSNYKGEVKKLENTLINLKQSYKNKEIGVDYTDIEDLVDIIDNVKSQEKYYVAAIAAASADLASKTVAVVTQAEAASTSGATAGFSVGVSLDVNGNKSNTNTTSQISNASNLNAKNIYVNTDETLNTNINITGSNLIANDNLNVNTTNLNVKASQDISTSSQDSKTINGSISFTMYGGGGGTVGLGYGQQNSDSNTLINNNSILQGNNVNINASNDAIFQGANVRANDTLNLNIGNNLALESLRDEYSSNSNGFNVNAGFGFGSSGAQQNRSPSLDVGKHSSTNAGFSVNNGTTINKQTVLSSIIGNKVNVNVGNNTHLKGALLASGNYDENGNFVDNKNLNFTTNTLSFENLSNSSYSSNQSLGGNFNYNLDSTKIVDKKEKPQQGGISSVGYNSENSLNVNASKTLATLGEGNITIKDIENSDEIERLNTDTSKINKDLYSSSTGTKVDATLDTRLLTTEGREQIKEDAKIASKIIDTVEKIVTLDDVGIQDFFKQTGQSVDQYNAYKKLLMENPQLAQKLQDENLPLEEKQIYANQMLKALENELGYSLVKEVKVISTDETGANGTQVKGYISLENDTIYSNDKNQTSTKDTIFALGQEFAGAIQNVNGIDITQNREIHNEYQNSIAKDTVDDISFVMSNYYNSSMSNTNNHNIGLVTQMPSVFNRDNSLILNNSEFSSLDKAKGDDLTIFVHGTYSSPKDADKEFLDILSKTYHEPVYQFDWSGKDGTENGAGADNSSFARLNAGFRLSEFVENYKFEEGETLNIIAHSHGGNVVKDFTQLYQGDKKIDNVIFLGTPVIKDYEIDYSKLGDNAVIRNVYDTSDIVQRAGGSDFQFNFGVNVDKIGIADRIMTNGKVKNIEVESGNHPVNSHSDLDDKKVWEQFND
jgi:filamentous hemagglutinin